MDGRIYAHTQAYENGAEVVCDQAKACELEHVRRRVQDYSQKMAQQLLLERTAHLQVGNRR